MAGPFQLQSQRPPINCQHCGLQLAPVSVVLGGIPRSVFAQLESFSLRSPGALLTAGFIPQIAVTAINPLPWASGSLEISGALEKAGAPPTHLYMT